MKMLLLYLLLVGVPVVGLFGILRVGSRLEAPSALDGTWRLDDAFVGAAAGACLPLQLPPGKAQVAISQSGRYLALRFNDAATTALAGTLSGATLRARHTAEEADACGAPLRGVMAARLIRRAGAPDQLVGRWATPGCAACQAAPFRAVRIDTE